MDAYEIAEDLDTTLPPPNHLARIAREARRHGHGAVVEGDHVLVTPEDPTEEPVRIGTATALLEWLGY